jgi:hypothetical protein
MLRFRSIIFACITVTLTLCANGVSAQESEHFNLWNGPASIIQPPPAIPLPAEETSFENVPVDSLAFGKFECVIAVNPLDSLDLIAAFIEEGAGGDTDHLYFSHDGGASWAASSITESGSFAFCDPWLAFDSRGEGHFSGLSPAIPNSSQSVSGIWHLHSNGGDSNWVVSPPMMNSGTIGPDEPVLAVDINSGSQFQNSLYSAAVDNAGFLPAGIILQFLRDGSSSVSDTIHVSQQQVVQIPHIIIGPSGNLYVSYIGISDISTLSGGLYFNKSTDGGRTFGPDQLIRSTQYTDSVNGFPKQGFPLASRIGPTPRIAIDTSNGPRRGWLYSCYTIPTQSGFPPALKVFLQRSTDDGNTWSVPIRVSDVPASSVNDEMTPAMCINPDGVIGVAYYDRRDDPNNLLANIYVTISTDGGFTFTDNQVTSIPTNPLLGYLSSSISIADYIGIASTRSNFFPIWSDGRKNTGVLDIYSAKVPISTSSSVAPDTKAESNMLQVYPNPASGLLHCIIPSAADNIPIIELIDELGRNVNVAMTETQDPITSTTDIMGDVNNLTAGIYFIRVTIGNSSHGSPIVVTH